MHLTAATCLLAATLLAATATAFMPAATTSGRPALVRRNMQVTDLAVAAVGGLAMVAVALPLVDRAVGDDEDGNGGADAANAQQDAVAELDEVRQYFNTEGFSRWNNIYSENDEVNVVQREIRKGHARTIDQVLSWQDEDLAGRTFCDLGCGVGSLAIPLAERGATVAASDISRAMAEEAAQRAAAAGVASLASFATSDLESVEGSYDTVTCIDVMIHYPDAQMATMVGKMTALAKDRLLVSFAPKTPVLTALKKVGTLFPGSAKTTRAYQHSEDDVKAALAASGFKVVRSHLTAGNFYFSQLYEAVRA